MMDTMMMMKKYQAAELGRVIRAIRVQARLEVGLVEKPQQRVGVVDQPHVRIPLI